MGRKKWNLRKLNKELASAIAEQYSIDPFMALLLIERGVDTPEKLDGFFNTDGAFQDPLELPDMEKAVERINKAIFDYERICVFGDYDADGVTATALLYSYLETQGADVTYLLPDRMEDGYGLSCPVADKIKALGTRLIITVDNGISAVDTAEYIQSLQMDMVITDHHLQGEKLPDCAAVVDPHRADCTCSFREYSGVGVALKLACALEGNTERVLSDFSDLAAIGTVADLVPLTGENRSIVKAGLEAINHGPRPGIQALLNVSELRSKTIQSSQIAFGIGPRINAAGRMEKPDAALDLLLSEDPEEAASLAEHVNQLNQLRHREEAAITEKVDQLLRQNPAAAHEPVLVVCGKDWHEGVLGIVASRLLGKYMRPVVVLSVRDGIAKGSARSIEGFSIYEAIAGCRSLLRTFGGHALAAGLSLSEDNVDAFRTAINQYAYTRERVYPTASIDCRLNPSSITLPLLHSIEEMEPFGNSNESPVFGLYGMTIDSVRDVGADGIHKRLTLHKENRPGVVTAMLFHTPHFVYQPGDCVDLMVTLNRNEFNGSVTVSVFIKDIRPAGADDGEMVRSELLYDRVLSGQVLTPEQKEYAVPGRALFSDLYRFLRSSPASVYIQDYEYLLAKACRPGENICRVRIALTAMLELGLLTCSENGAVTLAPMQGKVDLNTAPILTGIRTDSQ